MKKHRVRRCGARRSSLSSSGISEPCTASAASTFITMQQPFIYDSVNFDRDGACGLLFNGWNSFV